MQVISVNKMPVSCKKQTKIGFFYQKNGQRDGKTMPFIKNDASLVNSQYTLIDNKFITNFIPGAEPSFVSVYVFGMYLANTSENLNTIDTMKAALNLTEADIKAAYCYWEEMGLCMVYENPEFGVVYCPVRTNELYKKIKPGKYKTFNKQVQALLTDRMITPTEYNEYYLFLEENFFEPEALVAVVKYCVSLKGPGVAYSYVLAVARNLSKQGVRTENEVNNRLNKPLPYMDDLKRTLAVLGIRRAPDFSDVELYGKWHSDFGFSPEVIEFTAKNAKKGGMGFLDKKLSDYFRSGLLSVKEISDYEEQKTANYELARKIVSNVGLYYPNQQFIVDDYLLNWFKMGFDGETLLLISKYCATCGLRTLNDVDNSVKRFYKLGLTSSDAINAYIEETIAHDEEIRAVLEASGLVRRITRFDRQCYEKWLELGLPADLILYEAELSGSANSPMAYLNKTLLALHAKGITTLAQAKSCQPEKTTPQTKKRTEETRTYSKEELDSVFTVFD